jgi:hypothetical protein
MDWALTAGTALIFPKHYFKVAAGVGIWVGFINFARTCEEYVNLRKSGLTSEQIGDQYDLYAQKSCNITDSVVISHTKLGNLNLANIALGSAVKSTYGLFYPVFGFMLMKNKIPTDNYLSMHIVKKQN